MWKIPWVKQRAQPGVPLPGVQAVCVEPTEGQWTGDNTFGNRIQVANLVATPVMDVITSERLPGPPAPTAIHLFRDDLQQFVLNGYAVYAVIRYGAGLASNVLRCDYLSGQQFTIVCDRVAIGIEAYVPLGGVMIAPPNLVFGAMIGRGRVTPGPTAPTFTTPSIAIAAGPSFSAFQPLPDLARRFRLVGFQNTAAPEVFNPANFINSTLSLTGMSADVLAGSQWWPIGGGTTGYQYNNNLGVGFSLQWQFELGL